MKAVILAGGFGTRLRASVSNCPKSMALIAGKPFLHYQIAYFRSYGIAEFVLCVGYKADEIIDYFGDGRRFGTHISYAIEDEPLGTAGAFKNANLNDTFLGLNGDSFLRVNINDVIKFYELIKSPLIVCRRMNDAGRFGTVHFGSNQRITSFSEKSGFGGTGWINAGIYIITSEIIDTIPKDRKCSIEYDIFPGFIEKGLYAFPSEDYFIDIGTPQSYAQIQNEVVQFQPPQQSRKSPT